MNSWLYFLCRIPRVTVTQDEGHVELEISDDPYDVQTVDVKSAPCIVTLSKVWTTIIYIYIAYSHIFSVAQWLR